MDFLKNNVRFSFKIEGQDAFSFPHKVKQNITDYEITTTYIFENGLIVKNVAKKIEKYGAYEWVNYFENSSNKYTPMISDIWDADVSVNFPYEAPFVYSPIHADRETTTKVYAPTGSTWRADEFYSDPDEMDSNNRINHLFPGWKKDYTASGGRPCEKQAPFFRVQKANTWLTAAIGWTGQWKAQIERTENSVIFRSGIEKTNFRMIAGERFRTSSVVIMIDEGDLCDVSNRWRRLIKDYYSQAGKRCKEAPLSASIWGGNTSESMLKRVDIIKNNQLPYEYFWIDAGWYGMTKPTLNEYQGDWALHTGDWRISPFTHPNGLKDVAKAVHDAGMKLLLWFEFEHVFENAPILQEHPEWFIGGGRQKYLNLGNPEAYNYELDTLRSFIVELGIDCYRQDFNGSPLKEWCENDESDRQGITEIKHVNALYKLYDTVLEEFPHLIIDNCASGGRRIDIEMLKRSIPLWRTDYYCAANFDPEVQQMHQQLYSMWLPYHGACIKTNDEYVIRGAYSSCSGCNLLYYGDTNDYHIETQKKYLNEYLKLRPFFSKNFYALTEPSKNRDVWCASQYHDSDLEKGIIQVFKRDFAPYDSATFKLHEIDESAVYILEDIDNSKTEIRGRDLKNFSVKINENRKAKIYIYTKKGKL